MKMNGAEIIIQLLERQGISTIAGIPGGSNLPMYNALARSPICHILARHEQGAGFIAHGSARSTGKPAVCFATSGPGATNIITALADAKLDSIPLIVITGQVPSSLFGTDAFQEVNTFDMTRSITKKNYLVEHTEELLTILPEAFTLAQSGRPGPILIDVPKDIQTQQIEFEQWPEPGKRIETTSQNESDISVIAHIINNAQRPLLYTGGGITHSGTQKELYALATKNSIPLVTTLMGLGTFPPDDPLYLGMLGMHGARYTNRILDEADVLIVCGARFDDRATGKSTEFCPNAKFIHIDIDPEEINKIKKADYSLNGDLRHTLKELFPKLQENDRAAWRERIEYLKTEYPTIHPETEDWMHPVNFLRLIGTIADNRTIITTDVGQHQMWVAQHYPFRYPRTLLTSGGLGTMGFGLPAAIGAALANPQRSVICISGDGSIFMNIQELATLAELDLNVTIFVFNNKHLGLVRQQQELFYNNTIVASEFMSRTDFAAIGRSFGIRSFGLDRSDGAIEIIADCVNTPGPSLIDVSIDHRENVFPMVPPGGANRDTIEGKMLKVERME
jgi:acetolactate synthase I/II/III large subunit